jgi:hypothetical protein
LNQKAANSVPVSSTPISQRASVSGATLSQGGRFAAGQGQQVQASANKRANILWLFGQDWAELAARRFAKTHQVHTAGFDLFKFPSNAAILWFNMDRFVNRLVRRHRADLQAVLSHEEQFGALAAALVAERLGLPGTNPDAILKLQHKESCRNIIEKVAPECNVGFSVLDCRLGEVPRVDLNYPVFVKPVKASFSVLARRLDNYEQLREHVLFGRFEHHIIDRLVTPFDDVCQSRLGQSTDARRMLVEEHVDAAQFNLDGYVLDGKAHMIGIVDEVMYPDTQAFLRFEYPSKLPQTIQQRAFDAAAKVLREAGFDHGFFNMEFFYDAHTDRLQIVEFNPRLAAQLADLYERVDGLDVHSMSLALAMGENPASVPLKPPRGAVAASCALRTFDGTMPAATPRAKRRSVQERFADSIILHFPKSASGRRREYKWMNSNRFGVINLHGRDWADCRARYETICQSLGWSAPF